MSQYLLERDTVAGMEGTAVMTDGSGKNHVLFGLINIEADADIQSTEMKVVGTRKIQDKPAGAKQTGTAKIYYGTTYFQDMVLEYMHTGKMPYFDIQIINNDPTNTIGQQVMAYYGCKIISKIPLSILDADVQMLTMDISFSYADVQKLQGFTEPAQLGS